MGFYEDRPPPHGHRSPSDLADEERLEALHGNACFPPGAVKQVLVGGAPADYTLGICRTRIGASLPPARHAGPTWRPAPL